MNEKALQVLEYFKIIEMLAARCCSALTRDFVKKLRPSSKLHWIKDELAATGEALEVIVKKGVPPLGGFYDISGLAHLAAKEGGLSPGQLLQISYNLSSARRSEEYLNTAEFAHLRIISGLAGSIVVLSSLESEIDRCILSEDEIADDASPELRRIRRAILRQNEAIRSKIQQIVSSAENRAFLQDAIVTMRQGRFVVPLKAEHKTRLAGIVHDQSSSGATLFIEPQAIVKMNNELRELELAEEQEIARILKELSMMVGENEIAIRANQEILLKLDNMFAKGRLACDMNASMPDVAEEGFIRLRKARHPLIDSKKVVPVDVEIGRDYDTLVITGPNTGGKTVTLKTVGLLCLMAQSGLFIPAADGSCMPVFSDIFADIGDEQSIEQSLSTFSSHMRNIVQITRRAKADCLVLLDELGAGTDPTEGAALAMAILDNLRRTGALTMATTHYTELKKYAISTDGVENASMQFDVETLSPTFRLVTGIPGKSNAFEISRKLGLSEEIIGEASRLLERGDIAFEDVIQSIENEKSIAEKERREAERLRELSQKTHESIVKREERINERRENIIEEAKQEARDILDEARELINEIRKQVDEAVEHAEARSEINRRIEEGKRLIGEKRKDYAPTVAQPDENQEPPSADEITEGARVNLIAIGSKATVLSLPDDKGDFMVQAGSIRLNVNLRDVSLVQENVTEKERRKTMYSHMYMDKSMSVSMSCNVIGKTLEDAKLIVDKYLDDAAIAGLASVTIVHGRGEGILRSGLQKMFKRHKHVKTFRTGDYKEGGDGVTVVELK